LCSEAQEAIGRRRRVFTLTDQGAEALQAWLRRPSREATELRDPGLLQLFFADMGSIHAQSDIADQQLIIHRAKLTAYVEDELDGASSDRTAPGHLSLDQWRGQGLRMGVLYERAAVDFWEGVALEAAVDMAALSGPGVIDGPATS
jgi:hypothetical protein